MTSFKGNISTMIFFGMRSYIEMKRNEIIFTRKNGKKYEPLSYKAHSIKNYLHTNKT